VEVSNRVGRVDWRHAGRARAHVACLQHPAGKKMLRYAMVSVVSTILTFSVLGIVFGVFPVVDGSPERHIRQCGDACAHTTT